MASLYLNKVPPNPAWMSTALSVKKSSGLNQDPGTPILDVDPAASPTQYQRLEAVAGNDTLLTTYNKVHVQLWALAPSPSRPPGSTATRRASAGPGRP